MSGNIRRLDSGKWQVRFKLPDTYAQREHKKTFFTERDAKAYRNEVALQIAARVPLGVRLEGSPLLADLMTKAMAAWPEKDPRRVYAKRWMEWAPGVDIRVLDRAMIQGAIDEMLADGYEAATVRLSLAALRSAYVLAEDAEIVDPRKNPIRKRGPNRLKLPPPKKRDIEISSEQLGRALLELGPYRNMALFVILTGLRCQEMLTLSWEFVDLARNYFIVPSELTKSSREHRLPIVAPLKEIFLEQLGQDPVLVFPRSPGRAWTYGAFAGFRRRAFDRAGVRWLRIHDLRHLAAIFAVSQGGASPYTVKELLNHSDLQQGERYVGRGHYSEMVGKAIESVSVYLKGTLGAPGNSQT
jgi:integrase